jgi:NhaA family Na+:H+ antiporter
MDSDRTLQEWWGKWSEGIFFYPWERTFTKLATPFEEFIHKQTTSGIVLLVGAGVALIIANSPLREGYEHLIHTTISLKIGPWVMERSLAHWINEGLMTLFFFVVGLEIKREILAGELADFRRASLPIVAAIGGMVTPALIYYLINPSGEAARGWGIPMATDIAFCVATLVILGRRVPKSLMVFLVALAIVDDIGAVMVIALFYTQELDMGALIMAGLMLMALLALNRVGVRRTLPYFLAGSALWLALFYSGVHATIAGVLAAFSIPARAKYRPRLFSIKMEELLERYEDTIRPEKTVLTNIEQHSVLRALDDNLHNAEAPLQRMEDNLHLWVALVIIPAFALTNAGIPLDLTTFKTAIEHPVSLGVLLGLLLGKPLGITSFSLLAYKLGIVRLSRGMNIRHVIGVGFLGGIGFTLSIFIADLSFVGRPESLLMAKTGVILGSVTAGFFGYLWLRLFTRPEEPAEDISPPEPSTGDSDEIRSPLPDDFDTPALWPSERNRFPGRYT